MFEGGDEEEDGETMRVIVSDAHWVASSSSSII